MNLNVTSLKNRYYGFRHGESRANVEGIIVSDPAIGTLKYGLSDEGRRQVEASVSRLMPLCGRAVVVSSDFLRAVETAEIIQEGLRTESIRLDVRLRERFFGEWDGASYLHYTDTWSRDEIDPDLQPGGAESANAVRRRMVELVQDLDNELSNRDIILVSHGDPLRMLQSAFDGVEAAHNRKIPYFETAHWRLLNVQRV